jgi:Uma2 family endonuclease
MAPFSDRIFANPEIADKDDKKNDTFVLVPDIAVICDREKLHEKGVLGAPDFVVEVLSPSNKRHDRVVKRGHYLRAGVREYWIFDHKKRLLMFIFSKTVVIVLLVMIYRARKARI